MNDANKNEMRKAAAIALMDWSKWLVTLQPIAILAITGVIKGESSVLQVHFGRILLSLV